MGELVSTLTLRVGDEISAPIKKAVESLKGFTVTARELDKAVKLDALRVTQQRFRAAATDALAAQVNVKKLAQEFAAAENPTKQLSRALEQARQQASATARAAEQQSTAFRQARVAAQELGVPLNMVANEEQRLRTTAMAATEAMERQARTAQTLGSRLRSGLGNVASTLAPFFGPVILHKTAQAMSAGSHLASETVRLRAAGVPEEDISRSRDLSSTLAARYPNLSRAEILERYKEARSVLLHSEEALTELPIVAQTNSALKALEKAGRVEAGSSQGLGFALKGGEVLGLAQNPARLRSYLDAFVKAKQVMGELITPEQIYDFATNVKSSGALLSDRFLHTTAMSLTGELRGMRAGTGIDQFIKQITGGFQGQQHSAAKEFLSLGLLGRGDFDQSKGGKILGLKHGSHVAGWKWAQTDPDFWVKNYLLPAMKMKGITDEQEQLALVKKMFTSSRAADIVSKLITQAQSYENHAKLMGDASGLNSTNLFRDDPLVQLQSLTEAVSNFAATLTEPIMTTAAHAMDYIARSVAGWSASLDMFAKAHPDLAKLLGAGTVAVGGLGGATLTYGLIKGLTSGFGLKGSAAALDGSAAALTRAAIALGGQSIATGGVPGAVNGARKFAVARKLASALGVAGALYGVDQAVYDSLDPDTKRAIEKREDGINSVAPSAGMSKADVLRRSFNSDRARLGIPPVGASVPSSGLRFDSPSSVGAGSALSEVAATLGDSAQNARAAGETVGKSFRQGFADEMDKAIADANAAVYRLVAMLSFSASPDLRPVGAGAGRAGSGLQGEMNRGLSADYGVRP
jgi:hypothetical protein